MSCTNNSVTANYMTSQLTQSRPRSSSPSQQSLLSVLSSSIDHSLVQRPKDQIEAFLMEDIARHHGTLGGICPVPGESNSFLLCKKTMWQNMILLLWTSCMSDTKTCIILGGVWNTKNLDPIPLYWLVNRDFPYWAISTHTVTFSRG